MVRTVWIERQIIIKLCDKINQCNMRTQMNKVYITKSKELGGEQWKIYIIK